MYQVLAAHSAFSNSNSGLFHLGAPLKKESGATVCTPTLLPSTPMDTHYEHAAQ